LNGAIEAKVKQIAIRRFGFLYIN